MESDFCNNASISHQIGAQYDCTTNRSRGNSPLASASSYFLRSASFIYACKVLSSRYSKRRRCAGRIEGGEGCKISTPLAVA